MDHDANIWRFQSAQFRDARELFEAAREASLDYDRHAARLRRMEASEGVHAQSYQPRISIGSEHDVMALTDIRMDRQQALAPRLKHDKEIVSFATAVCYGEDMYTGGIAAMLGPNYADALWWRYCGHESWEGVATEAGMSADWCRKIGVPVALDTIDAYGAKRVARGLMGIAEG